MLFIAWKRLSPDTDSARFPGPRMKENKGLLFVSHSFHNILTAAKAELVRWVWWYLPPSSQGRLREEERSTGTGPGQLCDVMQLRYTEDLYTEACRCRCVEQVPRAGIGKFKPDTWYKSLYTSQQPVFFSFCYFWELNISPIREEDQPLPCPILCALPVPAKGLEATIGCHRPLS